MGSLETGLEDKGQKGRMQGGGGASTNAGQRGVLTRLLRLMVGQSQTWVEQTWDSGP